MVHTTSPVSSSPIFTYVTTSDPRSSSHDSLSESVITKGNPKPHNNPPNPVPKIPDEPDSDPGLSDYP